MIQTGSSYPKKRNIIFIHPDLGIGGAERLILDAAVGLQDLGHKVTIFTSHFDPKHCFEEAKDGKFKTLSGTIFPYSQDQGAPTTIRLLTPVKAHSMSACGGTRSSLLAYGTGFIFYSRCYGKSISYLQHVSFPLKWQICNLMSLSSIN